MMETILALLVVNSSITFLMCWLLEWLLFGRSPKKSAGTASLLALAVLCFSVAVMLTFPWGA